MWLCSWTARILVRNINSWLIHRRLDIAGRFSWRVTDSSLKGLSINRTWTNQKLIDTGRDGNTWINLRCWKRKDLGWWGLPYTCAYSTYNTRTIAEILAEPVSDLQSVLVKWSQLEMFLLIDIEENLHRRQQKCWIQLTASQTRVSYIYLTVPGEEAVV